MAAAEVKEASSSTFRCSYHVFLSFRGEDTRKTFTDHLYTALVHAGIRTFRDDDELERGEDIEENLQKAIQESRISIIVLSKDYASSRWCLNELVKILERMRTVGHIILPVFYHVDPSHVKKQTGSFAEAFGKHEEEFEAWTYDRKQEGLAKVERWREALREVADLPGMVFEDGHESRFIQKIVKEIANKLNRTILSVAPYQIGIDSRVEEINSWLQDGSTDVGIVAICGMGGIGKTTIAKTVYNQNFDRFDASSFLANIREMSEQHNGLVYLQRKLLQDILKGKHKKIRSVDEGIMKIKDAICCKRVLLVLDDVDQVEQLNAVLIMQDWFYPGSKIIITTRRERLLKAQKLYKMHKVKELNDDESLELFSWHAFGQDHPIEGYQEHSKRVMSYCRGLPLALQVLGSSLSNRNADVWESALKKLEAIPDSQILQKLKISFDSLQGDHDKSLFLDIAFFFVKKDTDFTITVLDGCDFYTRSGIDSLIDRCLLTIDEKNKLMMHQLLQDMALEIVRQESTEEPERRSRLWHHKEAFNVLIEKTGTETIEGLILNMHASKEEKPARRVDNSKRHRSDDFHENLSLLYEGSSSKRRRLSFSWLPVTSSLTETFSTYKKVDLHTDAFSRMHRLRILVLNNVQLTGRYEEFPRKLRWLCWRGFPLKSLPRELSLESLVALDMRYSNLERVWNGTKLLRLLKSLNLSHSHRLTNTPDFSELPNLERLIFKDCINLVEVHDSIGVLGKLVLLNLEDCKNLRKLPQKIGHLKSLEKLILSGCSKLNELPTELCKMESLLEFHADETALCQSPDVTGDEKSWCSLFWSWISKPKKSPKSTRFSLASLSRSLVSISLMDCNLSDDAIPRDLGGLSSLQHLNLRGNQICSLPDSIRGLTILQSLGLEHCTRLHSLPELPMSLRRLDVYKCSSLEMVTNLPNLLRSLVLVINGCDNLAEVQGLFKLVPIRNINAEIFNNLGFFNLEVMGQIEVALFNIMTTATIKVPLQGLYEFNIFSTFLPGNEVPGWFSNKSMGSFIRLKVPSLPNLNIRGLNVCVVYEQTYVPSDNLRNEYWDHVCIRTSNNTKDLKWIYSPTFVGLPEGSEDMIWLSHWKIGNQLEGGDEVDVTVFLWTYLKLKEFGIHLVYEQEENDAQQDVYPSCQDVVEGDLSAYQVRSGTYFLCHHDFDLHQDCSKNDGWTTNGLYDFLFGDSISTALGKYYNITSE